MKRRVTWFLAAMGLVALAAVKSATAAPQTWTGEIADGMCALAGHAHMGATDARKCTLECIKAGQPYALVVNKKMLKIANQKFPGLETYAGQTVQLTGELKGDTITVTKVVKSSGK